MSQSDQTVCVDCKRHGQDPDKRNRLHRDWWREYTANLKAAHQVQAEQWQAAADELEAKIVELHRRLADMKAVALRGYEQTPLDGIRRWLQEGIVIDAEGKMRAAYRARDKVMATIWRLDHLHHEGKSADVCVCGRRTQQCREFLALAPMIRTLDSWEQKQVDFLARGLEHHLPQEHPEVQKRRNRGWAA